MLNLIKDEKKQESYLIKTIPVISATNYAIDMIDESLKDVLKLISTNENRGWTVLKQKTTTYEKIIRKNLYDWASISPTSETRDFHRCYLKKLEEQVRFARMLVRAGLTNNLATVNRVTRMGKYLRSHCDECYNLLRD